MAELTCWNEPYGTLRIEKLSDTGAHLRCHDADQAHRERRHLYRHHRHRRLLHLHGAEAGAYEILELAARRWERDPQTYTTTVVTGECVTYTLKNEALPG